MEGMFVDLDSLDTNRACAVGYIYKNCMRFAQPGCEFTLKSGAKSEYYVDVRTAALSPEGLSALSVLLHAAILELVADAEPISHVAGVVVGGCPLATGISFWSYAYTDAERGLGVLYVRPEAKEHGMGKQIEGSFSAGARVALVEDVVTTGGSTIRALDVLQREGLDVVGVAAVVDREQGGTERIRARVPFVSLTSLSELLAVRDSLGETVS